MIEQEFLALLRQQIEAVMIEEGLSKDLLVFKKTLNYTAVIVCDTLTLFRIRLYGKTPYIAVPVRFASVAKSLYQATVIQKSGYANAHCAAMLVEDSNSTLVQNTIKMLLDISKTTLRQFPRSFDCCGQYLACSAVGKCVVHIDAEHLEYLGCSYRKNLQKGKIFYGENRNIG